METPASNEGTEVRDVNEDRQEESAGDWPAEDEDPEEESEGDSPDGTEDETDPSK